ncbi:twin-arginine translocase subunit TatC [Clostridium lacusfryxellense]|uniref:twin-arginine translocase subunit TatC n=1 Tax=Clostridium lacusfryxellense TaxID=205328 RepID=UPI001C0B4FED|nr:twin-arginine translocase subunit TatC [Clostridium lacusfryxellense]MBU3112794.1 twin-arginine translocase subunit TatC [Clostridium lacusfryxellense]
MAANEMSVVDHLHELRKRLIICVISISAAAFYTYDKVNYLIKIIMKPIAKFNFSLVYFKLTEGFVTRIEVSFITAIIITSPIIIYEILAFVGAGSTKKEKKFLYVNVFIILSLFIIGIVFGYTMILPHSLSFLILYGSTYLKPVLNGSTYFNFIGIFCLYTGIMFLIPYVLVLLGKLSLISSKILRKKQIPVILGVLVVEGVLLPSVDFLTFVVAASPVLLMYEVSIWVIYLNERRKRRRDHVPSDSRKGFKNRWK